MSDIFTSSKYAEMINLSKPYLNVSLALLVKKDNNSFNDYASASKLDTFTISYISRNEIAEEFLSYLPKGGSVRICDINGFFNHIENDSIKYDAHLTSAERAAALTLFHSDYKMVNPLPYHLKNGLVFPLSNDDVWSKYIDKWIDYRTENGVFQRIYDQWILGHEYKKQSEDWSIYKSIIKPKLLSE